MDAGIARSLNGGGTAAVRPAVARLFDVGAAIDGHRWTAFQKVVLGLAALAFIVDALANQVMAISIPALIRDWHVTRAAFSPVLAMGWVGVAIGTVVSGSLADRVGRKTMLLLSIGLFGVATALCSRATGIGDLLVLRTIDGVGIGGAIPAATTLIAEFTPMRRRSRAVNLGMVCIPLGNFLCGGIGALILPPFGWRALFVVNGGIALTVALALLLALPESPRFLAGSGQVTRLAPVLGRMAIAVPAGSRVADGSGPRPRGPFAALFGPAMLVPTLALWGGFFFCFLGVYSSLNWMPSLLASHGFKLAASSLALAAAGVGGMAGSLIMARLIEVAGSRRALLMAAAGTALGVAGLIALPLDPHTSLVPLLIGLAWVSLCLNAMTGCIYALAAHVYPPVVKATGMGAAGSVGRLGAISSSYLAVAMLAVGSGAFFAFIGGAALVAVACLMALGRHIPSDRALGAAGATA